MQGPQVQGTENRHRRAGIAGTSVESSPIPYAIGLRCNVGAISGMNKKRTHRKWMRRLNFGDEGRVIATRVS